LQSPKRGERRREDENDEEKYFAYKTQKNLEAYLKEE
jgi:hypothetical protein